MASTYILIIEDDEDIGSSLKELLESEGYAVEVARDGEEALRKLHASTTLPSLIILDLMMPGMDGFTFRGIQAKDPRLGKIPVVVMTADGHLNARKQLIEADELIRKPVDIETVLKIAKKYSS